MKRDVKHGRTGLFSLATLFDNWGHKAKAKELKIFCNKTYPEKKLYHTGKKLLEESKDFRKAELVFKRLIQENPSFFSGYLYLAQVQMENGDFENARENLEIADALNPYNSKNYLLMGKISQYYNDTNSALAYYRRSIKYAQYNYPALLALSQLHFELGATDSSAFYFNNLTPFVSMSPPELYYDAGLLAEKLKDTTKARSFFMKYLMAGKDSLVINEIKGLKLIQ
jgi:tetratricopeptide (TPR) repeat protein